MLMMSMVERAGIHASKLGINSAGFFEGTVHFGDTPLHDWSKSLADYGIRNESTVTVAPRVSKIIQLLVKLDNRKSRMISRKPYVSFSSGASVLASDANFRIRWRKEQ